MKAYSRILGRRRDRRRIWRAIRGPARPAQRLSRPRLGDAYSQAAATAPLPELSRYHLEPPFTASRRAKPAARVRRSILKAFLRAADRRRLSLVLARRHPT